MEAKELRIGNLVLNKHDEIHEIGINDFMKFFFPRMDGRGFKPIEISEEWLLKFGKIEWVNKDIDGFFYWFNGEKKYLKFVHSLQNTYFYIEQKELLFDNI